MSGLRVGSFVNTWVVAPTKMAAQCSWDVIHTAENKYHAVSSAVTNWTKAHLPEPVARISKTTLRLLPLALPFVAPYPAVRLGFTAYSLIKLVGSVALWAGAKRVPVTNVRRKDREEFGKSMASVCDEAALGLRALTARLGSLAITNECDPIMLAITGSLTFWTENTAEQFRSNQRFVYDQIGFDSLV